MDSGQLYGKDLMQIFANGIITGLTIAVLALAFTSVYLPTRVFHVALAGIYSAVPTVAWACLQKGFSWYWAILLSILTGIVLSVGCEILNHAPLEKRRASDGAHLVSSLGIYIIIVQTITLIWGTEAKLLRVGLDKAFTLDGLTFTRAQVIAAACSVAILLAFYLWLLRSRLGLQFRALADNPIEMAIRGYNVRRLRLVAFAIAGFLCSLSSLLASYDLGFDPYGGFPALLLAVVAVIVGGRDSFVGPAVGAIVLGVLRSEVIWFLSAKWQDAVAFLLLAIFILVRPNGLIGRKSRLEAEG